MTTKTWTVQVTLDEDGDDTRADAALSVENKMELRGRGMSRRNPHDESEPRIGDMRSGQPGPGRRACAPRTRSTR